MEQPIKLTTLPGHGAGKVGKVHVSVGSKVAAGDPILVVEADKGTRTVTSEHAGTVRELSVETGDSVSVGHVLGTLEVEGQAPSKQTPAAAPKAKPAAGMGYFSTVMKPRKEKISADLTIIGGGPGGYVAALKAAQEGLSVVLVEREKVGGTCLNWGCIPTKALVRSASLFRTMLHAEEFGLKADGVRADMPAIIRRKDGVVSELVKGIEYLLDKNGVRLIRAVGSVERPGLVKAKSERLEAEIETKNIIIATGSCSSPLPVEGADLEGVLDSKSALDMTELPQELAIIGGGVIGMEFAFIYASLGVKVTVVEFLDSVLATLEPEVIEAITREAEALGIHLYTGTRVEKIRRADDGRYILVCAAGEEKHYLIAERVLVAVGRRAVIDGCLGDLGLELGPHKRAIVVDEQMRTNLEGVYAIGDVTGKLQLAHVASHQGLVAVENILGRETAIDYDAVPSAIFTSPEIATVGLTEQRARENGHDVGVGIFPFAANGKALAQGERAGFVKIVRDLSTDVVLGGSIIGPHASDLVHEVAVAVAQKLTASQLAHTVHAHPTTSEAIHEAVLASLGHALHHA